MKQNSRPIIGEVAKSSGVGLDKLDRAVESFSASVVDSVLSVVEQASQVAPEHPDHFFDRLQSATHGVAGPWALKISRRAGVEPGKGGRGKKDDPARRLAQRLGIDYGSWLKYKTGTHAPNSSTLSRTSRNQTSSPDETQCNPGMDTIPPDSAIAASRLRIRQGSPSFNPLPLFDNAKFLSCFNII